MSNSVVAKPEASPVRRVLALFEMMLLNSLLLYLGITTDASFFHKGFLVVVAATFFMVRAIQLDAKGHIELRDTGLLFKVDSI